MPCNASPAWQPPTPRDQHRAEDHVEPDSLDGEEGKVAQDQHAATTLPLPGDDEADHHRQHDDKQQIHGEWLRRRVGDALANGCGGFDKATPSIEELQTLIRLAVAPKTGGLPLRP